MKTISTLLVTSACLSFATSSHLLTAAESAPASTSVAAETTAAQAKIPTLSINQAARRAWSHARDVLIAQTQLFSANAQGRNQTSFLKPQLTLSASYTQADPGDPVFGQSTSEDTYRTRVQVDQFLYGFGKRSAANDIAHYLTIAANADLHSARSEASSLVQRAYIEIWLSQAHLAINTLRVQQRQDELADSKALETAGSISSLDLRLADMNLATANNSLSQARGQEQLTILELARLLSVPSKNGIVPFQVKSDLSQQVDIPALIKSAEQRLLKTSDLNSIRAQYKMQLAQKQFNDADAYPQLFANANYNGAGPEIDDSNYQWQIGVGLQWKLSDGGAHDAQSAQALAQAHGLVMQYRKIREAKQQMLQASKINFKTLETNIQQQQAIIVLAEKNYHDTHLLYKNGSTTITRLGDSSLALEEARYALVRFQYQLHNLAITLQQLIEQEPPASP